MEKIGLQLKWELEVKDKNGKTLIRKTGISRSLLRNFMYWLQSKFQINILATQSTWTAPDTTNTSRTFASGAGLVEGYFGYFGAASNLSTKGLRIGILNTAVNPTDFELASLINHGASAGQMVYGTQSYEAVTVVGQTTSFRISRPFTNNSGNTITIKEIGAVFGEGDTGSVERFLLYLRDVLPASVAVPDGSTFTLRYTFSVTA